MTPRIANLVAATFLAIGCAGAGPRTQVMLEVDAEPAIRAMVNQLRVQVWGGEASRDVATYASRRILEVPSPEWPRRIALVPLEEEPERGYRVQLTALAGPDAVTVSNVVGDYANDRTVLLRVVLEDACALVPCNEPTLRCAAGACVDGRIDADSLPDLDVPD